MITLYEGSILDVKADVLVNPANSFLRHAGGLARIIDEAAKGSTHNQLIKEDWKDHFDYQYRAIPAIQSYIAEQQGFDLIPTGAAVLGAPGALSQRFKAIAHTVGPVWGGGGYYEKPLLMSAYAAPMTLAEDAGYESIVFPAISAGIFGVPIEVVAACAMQMAITTSLDVTFAVMGDEHLMAFRAALAAADVAVQESSYRVNIPTEQNERLALLSSVLGGTEE